MDDNQQKPPPTEYEETPVIEEKFGEAVAPTSSGLVRDIIAEESPPIGPDHELSAPESVNSHPRPGLAGDDKEMVKPKGHSAFMETLGNLVLFAVLFALGVGASVFLRQYLSQPQEEGLTASTTPQTTVAPSPLTSDSADIYANWKTYQVISANTKQPIAGISFKLPADVLAPICDGPTCVSQGTYLPGGSRLTVAARGKGQVLPSTEGAIMTDAGGRAFAMKEATISGAPSQEFDGLFAGTTGGGYTFAQIRGVVVHGSEEISLEVNHFTPTGVNANWDADDALFDKILESIVFGGLPTPTRAVTPIVSPTTNPQPIP